MICLRAKFVISPRIIVALGWGAGFKPVLQKCLLSAPSFWVKDVKVEYKEAGGLSLLSTFSSKNRIISRSRRSRPENRRGLAAALEQCREMAAALAPNCTDASSVQSGLRLNLIFLINECLSPSLRKSHLSLLPPA